MEDPAVTVVIEKYMSMYPFSVKEGVETAERMLGHRYPHEKSIITGELLALIFICGKPEFRLNELVFGSDKKMDHVNSWLLEKLTELKGLGCNDRLLASVYQNFWVRSEGKMFREVESLGKTRDLDVADWVRARTGFPGLFYTMCLAVMDIDEPEPILAATYEKMVVFIDDINDIASMVRDRRDGVLNSLELTESPHSRTLSAIADIFCVIQRFNPDVVEKIALFMMDYIYLHLDSPRYKDMGPSDRKICESWIALLEGYLASYKLTQKELA
ncbi:hypothetical protein [Lentzea sp. CC55]|uniref:hypothetical protein n=1 Tax=Lentzea sp. CC55 TaxID=2884909 RepID=UPI001F1795D2|nr:hypothetical protein [Lentzea sp. CC55]MCG8924308.1 hypothetical protein [Lentzea sp. CC55]